MTGAAAPSSSPDPDGRDNDNTGSGGSGAPDDPSREHPDDAPGARRLRWLVAPVALLLVVVATRAWLVAPYGIPSGSMEDTLQPGDRVLVSRLTRPEDLRRGDLVVFDATAAFGVAESSPGPLEALLRAAGDLVGATRDTDYVKRVVGVAGDHVRCCTDDGRLELNGSPLDEPYLKPGQAASRTAFDVTVPPGRFWVMGDNRGSSSDSRAHLGDPGGGMVPGEDIIGRVWVRYWPLDRLGSVSHALMSSTPSTPTRR